MSLLRVESGSWSSDSPSCASSSRSSSRNSASSPASSRADFDLGPSRRRLLLPLSSIRFSLWRIWARRASRSSHLLTISFLFRASICWMIQSGSPSASLGSICREASNRLRLKFRSHVMEAQMSERDLPVPVGLSKMPIWPEPRSRVSYAALMNSSWTS